MKPPTLLSLSIDLAVHNIAYITDLSAVPEPILLELFQKVLRAGKLTTRVLKLFVATDSERILSLIASLNIQDIFLPVIPTTCSERFL